MAIGNPVPRLDGVPVALPMNGKLISLWAASFLIRDLSDSAWEGLGNAEPPIPIGIRSIMTLWCITVVD